MPTSDWSVSVDAVANLLRARTRDTHGAEVGTFTHDTRPTDVQVRGLIVTAAGALGSTVGLDIPEHFWVQAATVVTYKTAMLVELSYFPEQISTGRSPYEQLKALYDDEHMSLVAAVRVAGVSPGEAAGPSYSFPVGSTLDVILGPPGGYGAPYGRGIHQ